MRLSHSSKTVLAMMRLLLVCTTLAAQCSRALALLPSPNSFYGVGARHGWHPRGELPQNTTDYLPPPSKDPWYRPPEGWQSKNAGEVLKIRVHAYPTINIKGCADTWQVLYRSTNSHGSPTWAVSTIFIPESHTNCSSTTPESCAHGIVSYQLATDSVWENACPSYLIQARDSWGEMRDLLAQGWILSTPDFQGPDAAYCTGKQTAYIVLDGLRATLNISSQLGMKTDKTKLGMWGYSGGATATEFAVEMAEKYAPEVKIDAAVIGGPTPNMTNVDIRMNSHAAAGLVITSLIGVTTQYPEARKHLSDRLKKSGLYNETSFMKVTDMTGLETLKLYQGQNIFNFFVNGEADAFHPIIQNIVDQEAVMGQHGVPKMPCRIYKAIDDEMSPASEGDALVKKYCDQGANILYHRNDQGDHNTEAWSGRKRMIDYLSYFLDGTSRIDVPSSGCKTVNVSIPFDPRGMLPEWMSQPMGPDGWPLDDNMKHFKQPQSASLGDPGHQLHGPKTD